LTHSSRLENGPEERAAVILNCVPAGFDAAHVGFVVTDVMGSGHRGAPVRSSNRPGRSDSWQMSCPGKNRCCRCLMCLPTAPVLPTKRKETSVNPNFIGSIQTSAACLVNHMATRILSTIGVVRYLTFWLQLSAARRPAATDSNSTAQKKYVRKSQFHNVSAPVLLKICDAVVAWANGTFRNRDRVSFFQNP
jgi:hypothetical protein